MTSLRRDVYQTKTNTVGFVGIGLWHIRDSSTAIELMKRKLRKNLPPK
jgi:hypothetical protein